MASYEENNEGLIRILRYTAFQFYFGWWVFRLFGKWMYDIVTMLSQLLAWQLPKNDFWFLGQISQDSRVTAMPILNIAGEIYIESFAISVIEYWPPFEF